MGNSILLGVPFFGKLSIFTKSIATSIIPLLLILALCLTLIVWSVLRKYKRDDVKFKLLVENCRDTIALINNGKWEYINPAGAQLFAAADEKELLGTSFYRLLDESDHEVMADWLYSEHNSTQTALEPIELKWRTLDGKVVYTEAVRMNLSFARKQMVLITMRDISYRQKHVELLIQSEKLSIAGHLAACIAHEIRNPLTSLKGFLQLVSTGRNFNDKYFSIMNSELMHIETTISGLLMLSKPQVYNYAHIDLRQLIMDTVEQLQLQGNLQQILIHCEEEHQPLWVRGVEVQLRQMFINILENAIEATKEGGVITIDLSWRTDGNVSIRIQDEGAGIPKEQLSMIGQPFYSTKDKGTGLGLMITYKIIDQHEGQITAESEVGVGTTFTILLPYHPPMRSRLHMQA